MSYSSLHIADSTVRFYWGIKLDLSSTSSFYTNAPFSVSYLSNTYSPNYKMEIHGLGQSEGAVQQMTVTISNADGAIGVLAQGLAGAYRFPQVTIYEWWYDASDFTSTTIQQTKVVGFGRMESPEWGEEELSFRCTPLVSSVAGKVPWKGFGHICPYSVDYKGEQCGSTDATTSTCGGTFTECTARSNTARFGGMRHTPQDGQVFYYGQEGSFIVGAPPQGNAN